MTAETHAAAVRKFAVMGRVCADISPNDTTASTGGSTASRIGSVRRR
jgi:hypothetical protein